MNKIVIIAQQIAQGMGYLHHRGIIHKDLKTKNIFLENGRAIITDFGLVNVARRLCANTRFGQEPTSFSSLTERYVYLKMFKIPLIKVNVPYYGPNFFFNSFFKNSNFVLVLPLKRGKPPLKNRIL